MLDVRVYRAAFLPALVALFVAAFSLADRPAPATSPLAADAFDGSRAFGGRAPLRNSLSELASSFPNRYPGSPDDTGLADRVAQTLERPDREQGGPAFRVTRERTGGVETVVGVRPGLSSRRIVVVSHRDAIARPGLAELSGTAAMLELARLFRARELRKTLVLVSTSGATDGFTGARAWAEDTESAGIEAVIVLGDMASARVRKPWVVPWSLGPDAAPLALQRTVENALRAEAGRPGGSRATAQWIRRALPFTVSEQGVIADASLPVVMIGASGERGPAPGAEVRRLRLEELGRATLRAVSAIDATGPAQDDRAASAPAFGEGPEGIVTMRNVLPDWAVRLLVGTLLLPAFLTALDGFFRVRRRRLPVRPWLIWLAASALPVLLAWIWARALGLTSALEPPAAPVLPLPEIERAGWISFGSIALVLALAWFGIRPLLIRRAGPRGSPAAGSLAAASGAVLCTLAAVVWAANPYAAALLLPAAHLWLFAAAPQTRLVGWAGVAAIVAGLLPLAIVPLYYLRALGLDPLEFAWMMLLSAASGQLSLAVAVVAGGLLACLAALLVIMRTRRRVAANAEPEPLRTRGPVSYAGPGSLGGTESALRR
ncbi:MAG TPA: M28 family peptidase [Solirubrobacteraceae bacterium]|nr:M28 family peptidase [Solirubrobacteraceae bacterium]